MSEPSDVPVDIMIGALDIIGRLRGIERAIQQLSDAVANLQIMVTAAEIARTPAPYAGPAAYFGIC